MYDIHIRPTGPNGNRCKLIIIIVRLWQSVHQCSKQRAAVSDISQSPLSDRTHKVEYWGCGCVPIVLASDDMQASAVEAVDTAHHCSSHQFQCPRQSVVGPDVRQ